MLYSAFLIFCLKIPSVRSHCRFCVAYLSASLPCLVILYYASVQSLWALLEGSDRHDKCLVHRQCSRNSPCPLDESQDAVCWGEVEAVRVSALGVRQATAADPKKPKVTSGKGRKGGKGSLLRGVNPPGAKPRSKGDQPRPKPGALDPILSESHLIVLDRVAKPPSDQSCIDTNLVGRSQSGSGDTPLEPIVGESHLIVSDRVAKQQQSGSLEPVVGESHLPVSDRVAKQQSISESNVIVDVIANEDIKGVAKANPTVNTVNVNPGAQATHAVDARIHHINGAQFASYPISSDVQSAQGPVNPRATISQEANQLLCPPAGVQASFTEPGVATLHSQANLMSQGVLP